MNAVGQPTARRRLRARQAGATCPAFPRWFSRRIPRPRVIARSRSLGYSDTSTQKPSLHRTAGGTHDMSVPMRDERTETYVRSALSRAGWSANDRQACLEDDAAAP